jgi:hypothetical protein
MFKYGKKLFCKKIYKQKPIPKQIKLEDNFYLQILSSLSKKEEYTEIKEKLQQYSHLGKIDDSKISNLINSDNKEILERMIEDELSEEEHGDDKEIRFVRPPHSAEEMKRVLDEAENIYESNKHELLGKDEDYKNEKKNNFFKNIPKYFSIKNLYYPPTDSEIIVLGVQRNSSKHGHFLSSLIERIEPDMIATQLSTDIPFFINSSKDYQSDWKEFIKKNSDYKFLVDPLPQGINDMLISIKKIERLYNINLTTSEDFKIGPKVIISKQSIYY